MEKSRDKKGAPGAIDSKMKTFAFAIPDT